MTGAGTCGEKANLGPVAEGSGPASRRIALGLVLVIAKSDESRRVSMGRGRIREGMKENGRVRTMISWTGIWSRWLLRERKSSPDGRLWLFQERSEGGGFKCRGARQLTGRQPATGDPRGHSMVDSHRRIKRGNGGPVCPMVRLCFGANVHEEQKNVHSFTFMMILVEELQIIDS